MWVNWRFYMRQDRGVVRHINGCNKKHALFQLLAEEPTMRGADHELNGCQVVFSALKFRAQFHDFTRTVAAPFRWSATDFVAW